MVILKPGPRYVVSHGASRIESLLQVVVNPIKPVEKQMESNLTRFSSKGLMNLNNTSGSLFVVKRGKDKEKEREASC
jgi:hypothetical protein